MKPDCPLCLPAAPESLIWQSPQLRIVWGMEADHPCLVRVVWQAHVSEMCELSTSQQRAVMSAVFAVEAVMKRVLNPKKLNLASLGNAVPHVHWHIIPRWADDAHWPNSIWAAQQRTPSQEGVVLKPALAAAIVAAMQVP